MAIRCGYSTDQHRSLPITIRKKSQIGTDITIKIAPAKSLRGELFIPPDKSISHRAVMLGAVSLGITQIENFLQSQDTLRTVEVFRALGVQIEGDRVVKVHGSGLRGLKAPDGPLYMGNSATTMRLLMGILAGQDFEATLTGDGSLSQRPMRRVTGPLGEMGAKIEGRDGGNYAPITIRGGRLKAITYKSPIASAQVKSAILLAGLYAEGVTSLTEPYKSRDHTERMLESFGADVKTRGLTVEVRGPTPALKAKKIAVPGDISSAAFFIAGAIILPDSDIVIRRVGINPTRTGILEALRDMGAAIEERAVSSDSFEPQADLHIKTSALHGISIGPQLIPRLIDELPIIMVAALYAKGETVIEGAGELRVKETDRINSMATNLMRMGGDISVKKDRVIIRGGRKLHNAQFDSYGDHRTAMAMAIAGLAAEGEGTLSDAGCIDKSFPGFLEVLGRIKI